MTGQHDRIEEPAMAGDDRGAIHAGETAGEPPESAVDVVRKALGGDRDTLIAAAIVAGIYAACLGITYAVRYCATKHAVKAALREM